jgi:hypothetical protein
MDDPVQGEILGLSDTSSEDAESDESEGLGDESDGDEHVIIEDDEPVDDDSDEDDGVPDEAKKMIKPSMKGRTKKRIVDLVSKAKQKDERINDLEDQIKNLNRKFAAKDAKEASKEHDDLISMIKRKQKAAFESGDSEAFITANQEFAEAMSAAPRVVNQADGVNVEKLFQAQNPWYDVDLKKTYAARQIDGELRADPAWASIKIEDRLAEVAKRTNELFRRNPNKQSSPSAGAPISSATSNTLSIPRKDLDTMRLMYPDKSDKELVKLNNQFRKNAGKAA